MKHCSRGFTLVELLTVIAIIALLAAILFPVLSRARELGRISACASNLKQIYNALSLYLNQYNDVMPPSRPINFYLPFEYPGQPIQMDEARKNSPDCPIYQIHYLLVPYITGKPLNPATSYDVYKVFRCPKDTVVPPLDTTGKFNKSSPQYEMCVYPKYGSSYQWRLGTENPYTGNVSPDGARGTDLLSSKPLTAFRQLSKIGAARDAQPWHSYSVTHLRKDWRDPRAGGNVLYLDGHVKWNTGGEFLAGIY
ncbi:MAG: type II secretion system protein [Armatimonadota bacterium]